MTLYYEAHGQGPAIVLVHGWGSHGGIWREITHVLAAHARVIVPDLPGHGRSRDVLPREFTAEVLAEEVQRLLPAPATWVGWSLGGFLTLAAAQEFPHAVERLVLVGATPKYVQAQGWPHAMPQEVLEQFARNLKQDYAGTLRRFLSLQVDAGEARGALRRLREELFRYGQPPTAALQAGLRLLRDEDRRATLRGIGQPALVIHGSRDRIVPPAAAHFLAGHLPAARLEMIAGAGHAPFLSHPAKFLETLTGFLHA
jgi:pimeloyl-[acyl-carrier protein] methyl ester esterase